ncbi:MAG: hypothetical protein IPN58_05370 [Anaerolineales bacterium]|nr:hypothetical protein [Anaerolineales bacterium]
MRDGNGGVWLYSIEQLPDKTYLVVAAPRPRLSIVNIIADEFLSPFLRGGLIALLLSLVLAFLFARLIADPLQKVVIAARGMPSAEIKPGRTAGPA